MCVWLYLHYDDHAMSTNAAGDQRYSKVVEVVSYC